MPRRCATCASPNRIEIETALDKGVPHRNIAEQFQLSPSSVYRHHQHTTQTIVENSASPIASTDNLTFKQRDFALAIVGEARGNGTEACRLAGYGGNDAVLGVQAHENLKNPKIQAFITQLRADAECKASGKILSATEVLAGLTRIAQADAADVFEPDGTFNLQKAKGRGVSHLIRSVNFDKGTGKVTKVELHDARIAYVDIGRFHKLWTDKVETNLSADAQRQIDALREIARETEEKYGVTPDRLAEIMRDVCPGDLYPRLYPDVDATSKAVS